MANYTTKTFSRYRQLLCGVKGKKLPPCENDIKNTISRWEKDNRYYDSDISEYEKGIINIWGSSDEYCDDDIGLKQLKDAAESGNAKAMNLCAMAYYLVSLQGKHKIGDKGSAQFRNIAVSYWQKGAEAKQCEALSNLAICYLQGIGVDKDLAKAKQLFKKAARYGHPEAKQYMRQAKLDKWKPGQDYDETPLTIQEAMNNSIPKPEKKTRRQMAEEYLQNIVIKSRMLTVQKALKYFSDEFPEFRIIQATDYEFVTVLTVLPRYITEEELNNAAVYPKHFKLNKVTRKIDVLGLMEMITAREGKDIDLKKYLKKSDLKLVSICTERGII